MLDVRLDLLGQLLEDPRSQHGPDVELVPDRSHQLLLTLGAIEIRGGLARARVCERLLSVHPLEPGRNVEPQLAAPVISWIAILEQWRANIHHDPADRVHGAAEPAQVDRHVVLDVQSVQL